MRRLRVTIVILICAICNLYAQSKIQATFQNGETLQRGGSLLEEDVCCFLLNSADMDGGIWIFQLNTKNGNADELLVQNGVAKNLSFSIKELDIDKRSNDFERYIFENDSSVYFKGKVIFKDLSNNIVDSFPVLLNLLPSTPKVRKVEFKYDRFDWNSWMFVTPILSAYIVCSREEQYYVHIDEGLGFFGGVLSYPLSDVINCDGMKVMTLEWITCWDNRYLISAYNNYGRVASIDTIVINNSIIDDPNSLKDYEKWVTGVDVHIEDAVDIYYDRVGKDLYIKGLLGQKEVKIARVDGALVKHLLTDEGRVCIPELKEGIYIVCIQSNGRFFSRKLLIN